VPGTLTTAPGAALFTAAAGGADAAAPGPGTDISGTAGFCRASTALPLAASVTPFAAGTVTLVTAVSPRGAPGTRPKCQAAAAAATTTTTAPAIQPSGRPERLPWLGNLDSENEAGVGRRFAVTALVSGAGSVSMAIWATSGAGSTFTSLA
jgi:hypothetical protein